MAEKMRENRTAEGLPAKGRIFYCNKEQNRRNGQQGALWRQSPLAADSLLFRKYRKTVGAAETGAGRRACFIAL
jgi:hypothetical protein